MKEKEEESRSMIDRIEKLFNQGGEMAEAAKENDSYFVVAVESEKDDTIKKLRVYMGGKYEPLIVGLVAATCNESVRDMLTNAVTFIMNKFGKTLQQMGDNKDVIAAPRKKKDDLVN